MLLKADGKPIFVFKRRIKVSVDDPQFQKRLAEAAFLDHNPKDMRGNESRDEINAILRGYGFRVHH